MSGDSDPASPGPREEAFDDLLRSARAGAGWAFARIHEEFAPAVAGYARLRGSTDPDGLTSEVFLGVFRGIGDFVGDEDSFRSWVFTIAHRRVIDERRRAAARPDQVALDPGRHGGPPRPVRGRGGTPAAAGSGCRGHAADATTAPRGAAGTGSWRWSGSSGWPG